MLLCAQNSCPGHYQPTEKSENRICRPIRKYVFSVAGWGLSFSFKHTFRECIAGGLSSCTSCRWAGGVRQRSRSSDNNFIHCAWLDCQICISRHSGTLKCRWRTLPMVGLPRKVLDQGKGAWYQCFGRSRGTMDRCHAPSPRSKKNLIPWEPCQRVGYKD